jgi:alkanesulfonate monooxygenase SsuD/methylene tetrahydromethanopterin reductase-like flavin-dependent oxidoreductase (luciferase family)
MTISTLLPSGPIHWGVLLAQGWKGELAGTGPLGSCAAAREWATRAEQAGFHGIWAFDHFRPRPGCGGPVLEAWTTLAALSQVTERIVLGTLVSCAAYRPAAVTVKMAQNLQILSGSRFCLGLGAGWDQPEFEAMGIPFGSPGQRSDQLEATLRACRTTWPGPQQAPSGRPLVLVGGDGEKRTLPAAAMHADLLNWQVGISQFTRKSHLLARLCEAIGRDPATIRRTHAPNFQLFDSEREFTRWRQGKRRGMSASETDTYIRDRGALYGTASTIKATIEEFIAAGCGGFMVFCNSAPTHESLSQLASIFIEPSADTPDEKAGSTKRPKPLL